MCGFSVAKMQWNECCFFRSRATSCRSLLFPLGCERFDFVRDGNLLCARSVLLLWLGSVMNLRWGLEQPHGSIAECMPRLQQFFGVTDVTCHIVGFGFLLHKQ